MSKHPSIFGRIAAAIALAPYLALVWALVWAERAEALVPGGFPPVLPRPGIAVPDKGPLPRELTAGGSLRGQVMRIVNYALTFVGIIGVIVVIYAGFLYLTSFGNEERGKTARRAIGFAVVGILLILLSYILTTAVIRVPIEAGLGTGGTSFPNPL